MFVASPGPAVDKEQQGVRAICAADCYPLFEGPRIGTKLASSIPLVCIDGVFARAALAKELQRRVKADDSLHHRRLEQWHFAGACPSALSPAEQRD